jgi:hypothetical protein
LPEGAVTDIRTSGLKVYQEGDIARERQLAERNGKRRGRPPTEIGYTGLEVFGNLLSGDIIEHNREWFGKNRFKIVDRMRRGDATCAATLMAITLPIISTEVVVETREGADGHKPDAKVQEAADFTHWMLFEGMEETFNQWLREACLYLAYGHYAFEKVFAVAEEGPFAGKVIWKELAPRHPSTFENFYFDRHGHCIGVQQQTFDPASNGFKQVDIPMSKMVWFTNQKEAGNPLGISVLRPAWKHWKYKDGFYAVQAIAVERQGAGVPFGKYPAGADDPDIDDLEETLQNIQAHEQSYLVYEDGWEVGFVDMGSSKILDPKDAIEHHDQMIPKSILAGFLNLTQGDRGSFALSSDSSGFFTYSIQQTANYIAGKLNKELKELLDKNFPNLPMYPKLSFNKVGHISLDKILDGITKLGREGFITPNVELENHVRGLLNLPAMSVEEYEEIEEQEEARAQAEIEKLKAAGQPQQPGQQGQPPKAQMPAKKEA